MVLTDLFKLSTREANSEVFTIRDSINIQLRLECCRENDLGLSAFVPDSSECSRFLFTFLLRLDVNFRFLLESVKGIVEDFVIEVFSS